MASFVPKLRIALCQLNVGVDKSLNISRASAALATAAWEKKSNLVVLPECWNCPYSTSVFAEYAEYVPKIGEIPDMTTSKTVCMSCFNVSIYMCVVTNFYNYIYILRRPVVGYVM